MPAGAVAFSNAVSRESRDKLQTYRWRVHTPISNQVDQNRLSLNAKRVLAQATGID
jgi:hypothetical protein